MILPGQRWLAGRSDANRPEAGMRPPPTPGADYAPGEVHQVSQFDIADSGRCLPVSAVHGSVRRLSGYARESLD